MLRGGLWRTLIDRLVEHDLVASEESDVAFIAKANIGGDGRQAVFR